MTLADRACRCWDSPDSPFLHEDHCCLRSLPDVADDPWPCGHEADAKARWRNVCAATRQKFRWAS